MMQMKQTMLSMKFLHHGVSIRKWEEYHKRLGSQSDSCRGVRHFLCKRSMLSLQVDNGTRSRVSNEGVVITRDDSGLCKHGTKQECMYEIKIQIFRGQGSMFASDCSSVVVLKHIHINI